MIQQEDNILMLHYVLNAVIQRNQLDLQPEVVKLLTDAAYEVKGCLLDGMESNEQRGEGTGRPPFFVID